MEWIEHAVQYVTENADQGPWVIFGLLVLSGFNIPVSEDLMTLVAATLSKTRPDLLWSLYLSVYVGVLFGDTICYTLGRILGPRLAQIRFFSTMFSQERIDRISRFYADYGLLTLIVGRFIPFGVRNGLFLAAGIGKMRFRRFLLADMIAAGLSTGVYFWLYYQYAGVLVDTVKGAIVPIALGAGSIFLIWYLWRRHRRAQT